MRRTLLPLLLVLVLPAAAAQARIPIRVGISDQQPAMFSNPAFTAAKFDRVRYVVQWNVMENPTALATATDYVKAARAAHQSVLLHLATDDYTVKQAKLPSVAQYRAQLKKLVPYFRALGVKEFGTWNEANHASEPTYKSPTRAADFFVEMYRAVKPKCSSCAVIALDVLDQAGVTAYMRSFYRHLSPTYRKRATVVGLHNYGDVNRKRSTYTREMIQQAHVYNRSTKFWLTETGGIVNFGASFPYSLTRAASRLSWMFTLADRYRSSGIQRMYIYQWTGAAPDARFDAGLTNPDGSVRPGYTYLRKKLPSYDR